MGFAGRFCAPSVRGAQPKPGTPRPILGPGPGVGLPPRLAAASAVTLAGPSPGRVAPGSRQPSAQQKTLTHYQRAVPDPHPPPATGRGNESPRSRLPAMDAEPLLGEAGGGRTVRTESRRELGKTSRRSAAGPGQPGSRSSPALARQGRREEPLSAARQKTLTHYQRAVPDTHPPPATGRGNESPRSRLPSNGPGAPAW